MVGSTRSLVSSLGAKVGIAHAPKGAVIKIDKAAIVKIISPLGMPKLRGTAPITAYTVALAELPGNKNYFSRQVQLLPTVARY